MNYNFEAVLIVLTSKIIILLLLSQRRMLTVDVTYGVFARGKAVNNTLPSLK